ncbi:hypothetical protein N7447_001618 [Penicillium robsamsonii]|uniref:uncharacterized protein n=1 Tax=Penicillium robsamsonii TaxID=1792511 RepID=UPI00254797B4|nr:uncharacterized protein N7447_001618 [Penicillium robsamsonii]KAJ5835592.1 hypothetical protein N7447_001618 [Penicillium robsamsonii]
MQSANDEAGSSSTPVCSSERIPKAILALVIRLYQQYLYGVWPVVNAEVLLGKLEDMYPESLDYNAGNTSCLIMAVCAATMAQLQLDPLVDGSRTVDSTTMAQTCLRMRSICDSHGANLNLRSVLVSFLLHVYHAKVNQQTSAMMFIQEAMAGARILRLNEGSSHEEDEFITNKALVFPLLWVSERGYSLHLGLSPSYVDPPELIDLETNTNVDVHAQGLIELVKLFITFDQISVRRNSRPGITMAAYLTDTEAKLASLCFSMANHISTRTADYHITREWMRTILWQEALTMGLLSSSACTSVMGFGFPAQVGRALLRSLRGFSETDLLPLGRDQVSGLHMKETQAMSDILLQLLKCFEVANSLADTVLLSPHQIGSRLELGPPDFLHALYQKIVPFLEQDTMLKSILRAKTAEALVAAPARLLTAGEEDIGLHLGENGPGGQSQISGYIPDSELHEQNELTLDFLDWLQLSPLQII